MAYVIKVFIYFCSKSQEDTLIVYFVRIFRFLTAIIPYEKEQLRHFDLTCSFPRFPNFLFSASISLLRSELRPIYRTLLQELQSCYISCLDRIVPVNDRFSVGVISGSCSFTEFVNIIFVRFSFCSFFLPPRLLLWFSCFCTGHPYRHIIYCRIISNICHISGLLINLIVIIFRFFIAYRS